MSICSWLGLGLGMSKSESSEMDQAQIGNPSMSRSVDRAGSNNLPCFAMYLCPISGMTSCLLMSFGLWVIRDRLPGPYSCS
jgi:hypothetical protein